MQSLGPCPLCQTHHSQLLWQKPQGQRYYDCATCGLIWLDPEFHWPPARALEHYRQHENATTDERYQQFLKPVYELVRAQLPRGVHGLDFGCGPAPALALMLSEAGYSMTCYDPHFAADLAALNQRYNFVVTTEVIEHLTNPKTEFKLLQKLLNPEGLLVVMTEFYLDNQDFATWYYHLDATHVVFYRPRTMQWIKHSYGYGQVAFTGKRIAWFKA